MMSDFILGSSKFLGGIRIDFIGEEKEVLAKVFKRNTIFGVYLLEGLSLQPWSYNVLPPLAKLKVDYYVFIYSQSTIWKRNHFFYENLRRVFEKIFSRKKKKHHTASSWERQEERAHSANSKIIDLTPSIEADFFRFSCYGSSSSRTSKSSKETRAALTPSFPCKIIRSPEK